MVATVWAQGFSTTLAGWNYGDVPTWIEAVATIAAFIAAFLAARWTARTARSAREQVIAAQAQVAIAEEQVVAAKEQVRQNEASARAQLNSMREQLEFARAEAADAEGRFLRAQLDALAPVVYARAIRPRLGSMPLADYRANPIKLLNPENRVTTSFEVRSDEQRLFGITFAIELVNCSDLPARVDFLDNPNAELVDNPPGHEIILPPHERRELAWVRRLVSVDLQAADRLHAPDVAFGQIKYWVRDLGMNVQDRYAFNLDLRYFSLDGSRLLVEPQPAYPWVEKFAGQIPPRHYERLEAASSTEGGAGS